MKLIKLNQIVDGTENLPGLVAELVAKEYYYVAFNMIVNESFDITDSNIVAKLKNHIASYAEDLHEICTIYGLAYEFLLCFYPEKSSYAVMKTMGGVACPITPMINGISILVDKTEGKIYFDDNILSKLSKSKSGRTKISWLYERTECRNQHVSRSINVNRQYDLDIDISTVDLFFRTDAFKKDFINRLQRRPNGEH